MATKKAAAPKKAISDIELVPDAWPRFEKFIREIAKAGPQHRAPITKPRVKECAQPVIELFEELRLLLKQPGCPGSAADSFLQMIQHLDKCVRVKFAYETTARTGKATIVLEPSDLFSRFISAFRACDWPLVSVIEHEICSSSAEKLAPSV